MGSRALKDVERDPGGYSNVGAIRAGRVCGLISCTLLLLGLLFGIGAWAFGYFDDSPKEVRLSDAVEEVDGSATTGDTGSEAGGIEGDWTVDTETGDFDYESATGSFVGFRIDEELASVGATEAVGRTGDVSGGITVEGTTVTAGSFEVDMTTITTNQSRRDDRVQGALSTDEFPTATFELTEPIELGAEAANGETVTATAVGDLTIKGTTQSIEMPIEAKLVDGTVVLVGSTEITFADFGVEVPSAPVVLSVADVGTLELQLLLVQG